MRQGFLAVRAKTFDARSVKDEIEQIAQLFGDYLSKVARPGSSSKHRQLGAVSKALQHVRTGARGDALKGYARRVHEQTVKSTFPAGPVEKLDEGLAELDKLLARPDIPPRELGDILSRIDYATYYDVKRRLVEGMKRKKEHWDSFVRENAERLKLDPRDVADVRWFGAKSAKTIELKGDNWKQAVSEFGALLRKDPEAVIVEDDEEEA